MRRSSATSRRLTTAFVSMLLGLAVPLSSAQSRSPSEDRVYLGFLGDSGAGNRGQKAVARQLELAKEDGKLDYVFLLGDNVYENGEAKYIGPKYLDVYGSLLSEGVPFHAALGNHDVKKCRVIGVEWLPRDATAYSNCEVGEQLAPRNRFGYVDGERYYDVVVAGGGRGTGADGDPDSRSAPLLEVFVVDTNTLASSQSFLVTGDDRRQLGWLEAELAESRALWKIVTMHHPIHSPSSAGWFSGHGREVELGRQLEPILTRHGVDVVFAGHNHFYARMVPQGGIRYFVSGGGGKGMYRYRPDEGYVHEDPERGKFHHFVHVRLSPEAFEYCVVDTQGKTRDAGWFRKGDVADRAFLGGRCPY